MLKSSNTNSSKPKASEGDGVVSYGLSLWARMSRFKRSLIWLILIGVSLILTMRLSALVQKHSLNDEPFEFGVSYVARYAEELGLDGRAAFTQMLSELPIKNVRLVSYWDELENVEGQLDFSELDWQFDEAARHGADVSLALGLRQPRWPECHEPDWAAEKRELNKQAWEADIKDFVGKVVDRYKDRENLKSYQLENEFLLKVFGNCPDFSRNRVLDEFNIIKKLDSETPVIMSRSNSYGFALGEPQPDIIGISIYRRVHNPTLGYISYPLPPWYYAYLGQGQKVISGQESIVHEFQLEPWIANGDLKDASIEEQNKTMDVQQVKANIEFARRTGYKEVYFWGAEWWYARAEKGDSSILDVIKQEFPK